MPNINLHQAIITLTDALDLVGVDEVHHGKRVAIMAEAIAAELGWSEATRLFVLQAGMLHDCGVSQTREHRSLTDGLEWEGSVAHCLRGQQYLQDCPPLREFAGVIRYHHTRWEKLPAELDEQTRLLSNLIFLADRVDVLQAPYITGENGRIGAILWEFPAVIATIRSHSGTLFAPELVDAFAHAASTEAFWLAMDGRYLSEDLLAYSASATRRLGIEDTLHVARLFSHVVDAKSAYTLDHSRRVAAISRYLARCSGCSGERQDLIEVAGLLHDLGKLRVPDEIIESSAPLDRKQRALVQRHAYDTYRILKRIFVGYPIAEWAGCHHENLAGTGYPFHRPGTQLDLEARIIAVADIFQAMLQNRPYRQPLRLDEVLEHLERLAGEGKLDMGVVALLRREGEACYALASS